MSFHKLCFAWGSSPVVGSSKKRTSGLLTNAQAIEKRCFWPPESSSGLALILSIRLTLLRSSATSTSFLYNLPKRINNSFKLNESKYSLD